MCRDGVQQSCHALDIDCCETASVRAVLAIVHRHAHVQGGAFLVGRYDSSSWLQQQGPSTPEQALAEQSVQRKLHLQAHMPVAVKVVQVHIWTSVRRSVCMELHLRGGIIWCSAAVQVNFHEQIISVSPMCKNST